MRISAFSKFAACGLALVILSACGAKRGDLDMSGQGIVQFRNNCPTVAVAAQTGDITLFDPASSREASAIDVVANITDLRSTCATVGDDFYTEVTYAVNALRRDAGAAREVDLPVFSTVVRGGTSVIAKRITTIRLSFSAGSLRAHATGQTGAYVNREAATVPPDVLNMVNRRRRTGDADAALDPLQRPEVKEALQRSSFELLLGFNLTSDQLRYNVTR